MTRILTLLNQKNHYLEKFYALNEKELSNFLIGNFDSIETFYETREKILEVIKYIDSEVEKTQDNVIQATSPAFGTIRKRIADSFKVKNLYVEKIVQQDLEILSCIESAKNSIIRELQLLNRGKKAVTGYKTKNYSQKLNEEI
ncbi:MAG: hypothetical protein AABY64_12470 [Bdellovibrionota bacterium]